MKITLPVKVLSIEGDGFHLSVKVKVNGKRANMIVDTGASKTVFDKDRIKKFIGDERISENERLSTGLGTNKMQSQTLTVRSFEFGKLRIENYLSIILDLSHVNATYEKLDIPNVDGVLGSDIFKKYNAVIDYGKKRMILNLPAKKRSPGGKK